jgi:hypothetical protein
MTLVTSVWRVQVEPNHAETLFNYGQFLWQVRYGARPF